MKLFFAALPLRIRLDFETSRGFCGLAQNDAHCVPAAQMARPGCAHAQHPPTPAIKRKIKNRNQTPKSINHKKAGSAAPGFRQIKKTSANKRRRLFS
ncbi:hypothetical protein ACFQHW_04050 [Lapidilactobacillus achengensis]|uniref:Uncharacterized protein n=1 Tax=Lapidilactobacillus achengensis TaxID=2486000 RepID=A0ABW1ULC6_9LACO|nr:hypothetical protein [Lapidilactobacillus achengensis]